LASLARRRQCSGKRTDQWLRNSLANAEPWTPLCTRLPDHADGIVNVARLRDTEIPHRRNRRDGLNQAGPAIARDLPEALDKAQG
jgi:hypothetical protein